MHHSDVEQSSFEVIKINPDYIDKTQKEEEEKEEGKSTST